MVDPFKMPQFEVPAEMRDLANKSVEQAKRAFDSFMGATQQAAGNLQGSAQKAQESSIKATKEAVGFAEQNVKAALDHAQSLVKAKGFDEVMKLQSEFMRSQMAAMQEQMKSMGNTIQETVKTGSAKPKK
jgi:phasin